MLKVQLLHLYVERRYVHIFTYHHKCINTDLWKYICMYLCLCIFLYECLIKSVEATNTHRLNSRAAHMYSVPESIENAHLAVCQLFDVCINALTHCETKLAWGNERSIKRNWTEVVVIAIAIAVALCCWRWFRTLAAVLLFAASVFVVFLT